ncbi:MAG: response regulator [Marinosulfonomonas sp.]|nr:response regulator [Marinosulfonomonas sp.]
MPDDLESYMMMQSPTSERPLLGLTVLVVEDSRFASEAMRLLCLRSGARIRRADSLKSARRHLSVYRPAVIIVDLGLPDGSGADLIAELTQDSTRVGMVLGISGDTDGEAVARAAGVDGFLIKPIESLSAFQQVVLTHLPVAARPKGVRLVADDAINPDPIALHDDLKHISEVLKSSAQDDKMLAYVAQFLAGIARIAHDDGLEAAATSLEKHRRNGLPLGSDVAQISELVQDRLAGRKAV